MDRTFYLGMVFTETMIDQLQVIIDDGKPLGRMVLVNSQDPLKELSGTIHPAPCMDKLYHLEVEIDPLQCGDPEGILQSKLDDFIIYMGGECHE